MEDAPGHEGGSLEREALREGGSQRGRLSEPPSEREALCASLREGGSLSLPRLPQRGRLGRCAPGHAEEGHTHKARDSSAWLRVLVAARRRLVSFTRWTGAGWRIRPLMIVIAASKATRTGLHGPPARPSAYCRYAASRYEAETPCALPAVVELSHSLISKKQTM